MTGIFFKTIVKVFDTIENQEVLNLDSYFA